MAIGMERGEGDWSLLRLSLDGGRHWAWHGVLPLDWDGQNGPRDHRSVGPTNSPWDYMYHGNRGGKGCLYLPLPSYCRSLSFVQMYAYMWDPPSNMPAAVGSGQAMQIRILDLQ